jgi:hypothetical protein
MRRDCAGDAGESTLTLALSRKGRGNYSLPLGDIPSRERVRGCCDQAAAE